MQISGISSYNYSTPQKVAFQGGKPDIKAMVAAVSKGTTPRKVAPITPETLKQMDSKLADLRREAIIERGKERVSNIRLGK